LTASDIDAKRYALRLLSYRGRSERELRERLGKKGYSEEEVFRTLDYLKQTGFIDDVALAGHLKRQVLEQKHLGYVAARQFMLKRGLSRAVIDSTLGYDEDADLVNAGKLLDKKCRTMGNYLTEKDKKRLYDFLARRGFARAVIGKALKQLTLCEGEDRW
jgi:regulatory protein